MCASRDHTPLDEIDRAILQILQRDARNATAVEIAEPIGVSDGTVRNRIQNLEDRGIIEGYTPLINYEKAGYQLQIKIVCTAPIVERAGIASEALDVEGVIEVDEIMTGRENVIVTAVAPRHDDITRIAKELDGLGLSIESEQLLRHHYFRPFNHFGTEDAGDDADAAYDL